MKTIPGNGWWFPSTKFAFEDLLQHPQQQVNRYHSLVTKFCYPNPKLWPLKFPAATVFGAKNLQKVTDPQNADTFTSFEAMGFLSYILSGDEQIQVLLEMDGAKLVKFRKIIGKAFTHRQFPTIINTLNEVMRETLADVPDGRHAFGDIIFDAMFINSYLMVFGVKPSQGIATAWKDSSDGLLSPFRIPLAGRWRKAMRAGAYLRQEIGKMVDHMAQDGSHPESMAGILLNERDDDGHPIPRDELLANLEALVIAAHNTTVGAIRWICELMVRSPDVLQGLNAELAQVNGDVTLEQLKHAPYFHAVLTEEQRFIGTVSYLFRYAAQDTWLYRWDTDEQPTIPVKRGTYLLINPNMFPQRDPLYYTNPELFDPNRWRGPNPPPKLATLGFGHNDAHGCLARDAAPIMVMVVFCWLLRTFEFSQETTPLPDQVYLPTGSPRGATELTVRRK